MKHRVLMAASVASMIDQFNMPNIRLLLQLGYEVHVACNFREGNTCDAGRIRKLLQNLKKLHVAWHQWDCPRGTASITKCVRAYRQLLELMEAHPFAWVHCHSPVGGALARMAAHKKGVRIVYTAHGFHFYKGAPLKNWLLYFPAEYLLAHWTDVLVTVNREDFCLAKRRLSAKRVCCIPGIGMDAALYGQKASAAEKQAFRKKYGLPHDAIILLSVGELSKRKNHRMVVRVLEQFAEKNVYYMICGQGPLHEALLRQAKKAGILDCVRIAGFQEDVAEFYRNADIFVFPSVQEGLPAALMEAMASGLPCVVSDIRGNRELVRRKYRFPLTEPHRLAKMIRLLLCDRQMREKEGKRNREKAREYSQAAVQKKMLCIYESAELKMQKGKDNARDFCLNGYL